MTSSCIVLTAHGDAPFLGETLRSIDMQTRPADGRIAVVDCVNPDTVEQLVHHHFTVLEATSIERDSSTRIAQNFLQGVRAAKEFDVVILGDHDDIWHAARIERHLTIMDDDRWLMTAGNGLIIDADGNCTHESLRDVFPVPSDWNDSPVGRNLRYAMRHSVATGGASAIRTAFFADRAIPRGWLHDRWWSLAATKRGALNIDDTEVIDYRVTGGQQVGLATARQEQSRRWWAGKLAQLPSSLRRMRDVSTRL